MRLFCLFILLSVSRFSENIIKRKHLPNACTYVIEKNDQNQIIKRKIRNKDESGKDFAKRLMDEKYGSDNYQKGPRSDFNKIKKWGDRAFE